MKILKTVLIVLMVILALAACSTIYGYGVVSVPTEEPQKSMEAQPSTEASLSPTGADETESSEPTSTVTPVPTPTIEPTPKIPEDILIFEPELWVNAEMISKKEGAIFPSLAIVVPIPIRTEIYSPFDGIITICPERNGQPCILWIDAGYSGESAEDSIGIELYAYSIDLAPGIDSLAEVKAGQLIGTIESDKLVFADVFDNPANFLIVPLVQDRTFSSDDPSVIIQEIVARAEEVTEN
ncbi:MAG: hypothetical protein PHP35_01980 [Candidatus Colwellbacteria bacterium]|nr:hypothetical protein [Candidatus Colwellbacteria bacterium]